MRRFVKPFISLAFLTVVAMESFASGKPEAKPAALPHDWVNYGEAIQRFSEKYGIKANKDNKGPQAPDVIDVGLSFGPQAKADGLIAPYKVSTWDTIPNEVNLDVVKNPPLDWPDLPLPAFKGQVALARALAVQPRVLLLDEPLSALDAKIRVGLRGEIRAIQRQTGITTVYVTHDQAEALSLSDRVAVMQKGCIEQIGTPFEIYSRPAIPATMIDPAAGRLSVDGQEILAERPVHGVAGQRVRLSPRPEMISLGDGSSGSNRLAGTVSSVIFLGSIVRVVLRTESNEFFLDTFNNPHLALPAAGAQLTVGFPQEACLLIEGET